MTFHIQDMTDVLSDVIWESQAPYTVPVEHSGPLADAMTATGELLSSFTETDKEAQKDCFDAARAAVEACMAATAAREPGQGSVPASESILLSLHRILRAVRPAD